MLFFVLVGVCPLLLGVLMELLMLPVRVSPSKSPILFLYQDWVLGLLCLKLWHRAIMVTPNDRHRLGHQHHRDPAMRNLPQALGDRELDPIDRPAGQPAVLGQQREQEGGGLWEYWRQAFVELQRGSLCEETLNHAWHAIALPLLLDILTALAMPYGISRGLLPALRVIPEQLLPVVQLYSYHAVVAAFALGVGASRLRTWTATVHNSIRDQRCMPP